MYTLSFSLCPYQLAEDLRTKWSFGADLEQKTGSDDDQIESTTSALPSDLKTNMNFGTSKTVETSPTATDRMASFLNEDEQSQMTDASKQNQIADRVDSVEQHRARNSTDYEQTDPIMPIESMSKMDSMNRGGSQMSVQSVGGLSKLSSLQSDATTMIIERSDNSTVPQPIDASISLMHPLRPKDDSAYSPWPETNKDAEIKRLKNQIIELETDKMNLLTENERLKHRNSELRKTLKF